ncbi:hypothetical protein AB6878_02455 [Carnobacterium maltaromaticum]|uniref:hypothetical protein n=1 Tax=Carnobacterium maltaromaticum TaxID=2751 RepID=UPI0039BE5ECD
MNGKTYYYLDNEIILVDSEPDFNISFVRYIENHKIFPINSKLVREKPIRDHFISVQALVRR